MPKKLPLPQHINLCTRGLALIFGIVGALMFCLTLLDAFSVLFSGLATSILDILTVIFNLAFSAFIVVSAFKIWKKESFIYSNN